MGMRSSLKRPRIRNTLLVKVASTARIFSMKWKGIVCEKVGEDGGKRYHPTQKPVRLMSWCLWQLRDPTVVLDPYMGSGSAGVAVVRERIGEFIGVEIERRFFDIACERVDRELRCQIVG